MSTQQFEQLVNVVERLPASKVSEVIDFAQFLLWQGTAYPQAKRPIEEWAENLAKERGFDDLTEDDVAQIVHESRQEKKHD